jgi:hypothetical protein
MGDMAAFGGCGLRRLRRRVRATALAVLSGVLLAGCSPAYDWRDSRAPGGEYWVQFPAKPAAMTRQIHLESLEVDMTMQGARVKENAFTVATVPLPAQDGATAEPSPERILAAMREQMLRNIGAPASSPSTPAPVAIVDANGRKTGTVQWQAVDGRGSGRHAAMALRGRFGIWRGHAVQVVAVGPDLDPEQASYFLDSLKLVER